MSGKKCAIEVNYKDVRFLLFRNDADFVLEFPPTANQMEVVNEIKELMSKCKGDLSKEIKDAEDGRSLFDRKG